MNKTEEIYLAIIESVEQRGYPPTLRELCKSCNIKSTSDVQRGLKELEKQRKIELAGSPRAITLCEYDVELRPRVMIKEEKNE